MEHHANIVPWQILAGQTGLRLVVAPITDEGELLLGGATVPYVAIYRDYEYYYGYIYGPTFAFRYYGDYHSRRESRVAHHSRAESRDDRHSKRESRFAHLRRESRDARHSVRETRVEQARHKERVPEAVRRKEDLERKKERVEDRRDRRDERVAQLRHALLEPECDAPVRRDEPLAPEQRAQKMSRKRVQHLDMYTGQDLICRPIEEEIITAAPARQFQLLRRFPVTWEMLATPRELLRETAERYQLTIENPEAVPHDLWAAGGIAYANAAEALMLVLVQFDLEFEWLSPHAVRIVPAARGTAGSRFCVFT